MHRRTLSRIAERLLPRAWRARRFLPRSWRDVRDAAATFLHLSAGARQLVLAILMLLAACSGGVGPRDLMAGHFPAHQGDVAR